MPNKKISELNPTALFDDTELIPLVQGGETVYTTLGDLIAHIVASTSYIPANLPYRGARVRLSASYNPASTGFVIVSWDTEDRDTDGFWSLAQPTRLVIPAGVSKIRLMAYIRSQNGPTGRYAFFKKNGAYFIGGGGIGASAATYDISFTSDVINVTAGDYFELELFGSTSTVTGGAGSPTGLATWFALQVCEVS